MSLPAFPGAEGFGSQTPHGRGGKVIAVTNVNDSGPGSLREAAGQTQGRRIIVFQISGIIHLESPINIRNPYCMIAGQSAPGDGICLTGAQLNIATHDVVVRYIRSRPGDLASDYLPENRDGYTLANHQEPTYNIVLDHLSASWAIDENMSTWYECYDITIQWCIISEALNDSLHPKGPHGKGLLVGDQANNISIHHNLFAHNSRRNPLLKAGTKTDIVNNVIYNWQEAAIHLSNYEQTNQPIFSNIVGNYFKAGKSTEIDSWEIDIPDNIPVDSDLYVSGNTGPHRPENKDDDWLIVRSDQPEDYRIDQALAPTQITTSLAQEAYTMVLEDAGAVLPNRDSVDTRIIEEVITETGSIIDKVSQTPGYPAYKSIQPLVDTDLDGMPDTWEQARGLLADQDDSAGDRDNDGYSNIEEYLNYLVAGDSTTPRFHWNLFLPVITGGELYL